MKKYLKARFITKLRNLLNIKPVHISIDNVPDNSPISDFFPWRNDEKFETYFRFTDFRRLSTQIQSDDAEIYIFDRLGNLIFKNKIFDLKLSNCFKVSDFIGKDKKFGSFFLFINNSKKFNFRNSCYTGFSYQNSNPSFVHGNIPVSYLYKKKLHNEIVGKSLLKNNNYFIQDYFNEFEKVELVFSNPTNSTVYFSVNEKNFSFKRYQTKIVDISNMNKIKITSNCYFLRPYIFKYKNNFIDAHHA